MIMGTVLRTKLFGNIIANPLAQMCDKRHDPGCHLSSNEASILILHNSHGALTEVHCEKSPADNCFKMSYGVDCCGHSSCNKCSTIISPE